MISFVYLIMKKIKNNNEHYSPPVKRAKKAYNNKDFLHSPAGREVRILSEYQYPLHHFSKNGIKGAIIFFGSSRIKPTDTFEQIMKKCPEILCNNQKNENLEKNNDNIPNLSNISQFYDEACILSKMTAEWLKTLGEDKQYLICTGGGPGIMEAANRGAFYSKEPSIGLNISLPHEQQPNRFIHRKFNFEFHYFFMRKFWFVYLARLVVVFPGGFGTMDELMEILTLKQTNKISRKLPIILYSENFWKKLINFELLIEFGLISPEDMDLFKFANSPDEAFKLIKELI